MWIRNPWWDGAWFLSGFPLALIIVLASEWSGVMDPRHLTVWFVAVAMLDTAHRISPVWLAWSHSGFRAIAARRPMRFIVYPAILLALGAIAGWVSQHFWPNERWWIVGPLYGASFVPQNLSWNPLIWLTVIYYIGNAWHFAMQNFGIAQIYKMKSEVIYPKSQRRMDQILFLTIQFAISVQVLFQHPQLHHLIYYPPAIMTNHAIYLIVGVVALLVLCREAAISGKWLTPRILFMLNHMMIFFAGAGLWVVVIASFNHWLSAIGLASHIDGVSHDRSPIWTIAAVTILGTALAAVLFISPQTGGVVLAAPLLGLSTMIGVVHFSYDRGCYRFSDPQVRATIGLAFATHLQHIEMSQKRYA